MRSKERVEVPADFIPKSEAQGVTIYWDDEIVEALDGITEQDFKAAFMEMLETAKRYSQSFDPAIKPDVGKFSDRTTRVCVKMIYAGWKRGLDSWRQTCYEKMLGALKKGGGDVDRGTPTGDAMYGEVKQWISQHGAPFDVQEALRFISENQDIPWNSALIKLQTAKMGLR